MPAGLSRSADFADQLLSGSTWGAVPQGRCALPSKVTTDSLHVVPQAAVPQAGWLADQRLQGPVINTSTLLLVLMVLMLLMLLVLVLLVALQDEDFFHKIPEPTEDELDMLDLAFGLTET